MINLKAKGKKMNQTQKQKMGRNNRGQAKLVNDTKFYCQPRRSTTIQVTCFLVGLLGYFLEGLTEGRKTFFKWSAPSQQFKEVQRRPRSPKKAVLPCCCPLSLLGQCVCPVGQCGLSCCQYPSLALQSFCFTPLTSSSPRLLQALSATVRCLLHPNECNKQLMSPQPLQHADGPYHAS